MRVERFLAQTAAVLKARQQVYGDPKVTLTRIAGRWSLTLGHPVTAQQVALCMIDVKLARLAGDAAHHDSLVDIAGYAACLSALNNAEKDT